MSLNAKTARRSASEGLDRKSTRLNSSHLVISYAVFCLKKKRDGRGKAVPQRPFLPAPRVPADDAAGTRAARGRPAIGGLFRSCFFFLMMRDQPIPPLFPYPPPFR